MRPVFGLRAALMLLVLIAFAPVFAVVAQASIAEQRARLQRAEASLRSLVELGAAHQERLVEGARQLLTAIASAPPVYQGDNAACAGYLRKLQLQYPESYGTFGILDPTGLLTCRAAAPSESVRSSDRPFFASAVRTGQFTVGEYTVSRASGRRVLTFGLPVYDEGRQLRGVAYLALDLARSSELLEDIAATPEVTLLVTDAEGIVLAAAGPGRAQVGAPAPGGPLRDALAAGVERFSRVLDADGGETLLAVRPVGRPGDRKLFVAGSAGRDAILAGSTRRLQLQLAAIGLIMLGAAGLAWVFADRVLVAPMRRLLGEVESLALEQRRLDGTPPPSALREVGELHGRFHQMARRLAERAVQRDGAMAEMEHQKNLVESVLGSMAEGVLVLDRQGLFVHVNEAARAILPGLALPGRARDGAWAASGDCGVFELDGSTPARAQDCPVSLALAGSEVRQFRYVVRGELCGGRELVVQGSARPVAGPDGTQTGAVVVFSDVTQTWRAEQALRDSEQRYRSMFESNPHPMWVYEVATLRFLTVNDAAVAHYGYSREEFLAMTIADIRPPQEAEALRQAIGALDAPMGAPGTWRHRCKDGRLIQVEVTSHAMQYQGRAARLVLAHDITQRMLAEAALHHLNETLERRVEERTRELAAANQELESFSYSVSHDLRAPLQVIDGFGQALATRHAERLDGQARHYLERIRENTRQMSQLIDDLLALARVTRAELEVQPFDLARLAADVVEQLRHRSPGRTVAVEIEPAMPCQGDPRLVAVLLENLVGNAWKFTGRVAQPRIRIGCLADAGAPVYFVQDNGAGFDMAYADKLFKPFQRLHPSVEFEGTGIGLATVQRIVTRHGGRVWAQARQGEGAGFYFTLAPGSPGSS